MSGAVAARDAATVKTKLHIQILNADVVDQLIEGSLQEGRINGANRNQPFTRHAGCEGDAMLFSNANVERSLGKLFERLAHSCSIRHRGGKCHHLLVLLHQLNERLAEY